MRMAGKKKRVLYVEILVLLVLICILGAVLINGKRESSASTSSDIQKPVQKAEEDTNKSTEEISPLKKEARKIYRNNKKYLILANKNHEVPDNYDSNLMYICDGRLQASEWIYEDLKKMLNDADADGYTFFIASAYRSKERQQDLVEEDVEAFMNQGMSYQNALDETLRETMPSGYSEHQTGLALDILCSDNLNMDVSQENSEGNKWLRDHCAEYGFILRYPEDKVDITLISYEPWHFRYVGKEAAKFMTENKLTLEEFWNLISDETK